LFNEFFPKKKEDMPTDNLKRLVKAFETPKDLTLMLKRSLVKRGAKATIALTMS
jgi:hypothetical protein